MPQLTTPVELTQKELDILREYYRHNGARLDKYSAAVTELRKLNTIKNREHKQTREARKERRDSKRAELVEKRTFYEASWGIDSYPYRTVDEQIRVLDEQSWGTP